MPTFFFRSTEFKSAPRLEFSRCVAAILHLSIPVLMYSAMNGGIVFQVLSQYMALEELSDDRKAFYLMLDVFYSVRWAIGVLVMQGDLTLIMGATVALKHLIVDEAGYIVSSMMIHSWSFRGMSQSLTVRDYACGAVMIVAGILQHGSELQRWNFKRDPKNIGKIHTDGLFRYARGVNHTGHILRDVAHILLAPNKMVLAVYAMADYDLAFNIVPETQRHMRNKYGEQWGKYEKQTPGIFWPKPVAR